MWVSKIGGGSVDVIDRTPRHDQAQEYYEPNSVKLLKFRHIPSLSRVESWTSRIGATISSHDYYYWSWYFHKGTRITIDWEFLKEERKSKGISVYLVMGENGFDAFDKWTSSPRYFSILKKPFKHIYLESYGSQLSFDVQIADFYFVFFYNDNSFNASGYFEYSVSSTLYDVSHPDESCNLPCDLPVTGNDVFMLASPSATVFPDASGYSVNTDFSFTPRFAIKWTIIWAVVLAPACLFVVLSWGWYSAKNFYARRLIEPH
eukprot:Phypoly_transcript_15062.p1 GENE.Phypoly_transcript_15062~~Phypoly_transcript_15062.p1  ORF type:complete len:261 (+),score=13.13 Phypoly_transcript_15062:143-925(+)